MQEAAESEVLIMDKKTYDKLMSSYTEKMELLWTHIGQEIIYLWEEAKNQINN